MEKLSTYGPDNKKDKKILEELNSLMISIANEVLLCRPTSIYHFVARTLESQLDRRTLWEMQFDNETSVYPETTGMKHKETKNMNPNMFSRKTFFESKLKKSHKFYARDSYLSHLAMKKLEQEEVHSKKLNITKLDLLDNDNKPNYLTMNGYEIKPQTLPYQKSSDNSVKFVKFNYIPSHDCKLEDGVYKKVLSSMNLLIEIAKNNKSTKSGFKLYHLLKETNMTLQYDASNGGVISANCLKPSIFKKLQSDSKARVKFKNGEDVQSKDKEIKRDNFSKLEGNEENNSMLSEKRSEMDSLDGMLTKNNFMSARNSLVSLNGGNTSSMSITSEFEYNKKVISSSNECLTSFNSKMRINHTPTKIGVACQTAENRGSKTCHCGVTSVKMDKDNEGDRTFEDSEKRFVSNASWRVNDGETRSDKNSNSAVEGTTSRSFITDQTADETSLYRYIPLTHSPEQFDFLKLDKSHEISCNKYPHVFQPVRNKLNCKKDFMGSKSESKLVKQNWFDYQIRNLVHSSSAQTLGSNNNKNFDSFSCKEKFESKMDLLKAVDQLSSNPSLDHHVVKFNSEGALSQENSKFNNHLFSNFFGKENENLNSGEYNSEGQTVASKNISNSENNELNTVSETVTTRYPWPSIYYQTTWIDESYCSLVAASDNPFFNEKFSVQSSIDAQSGISKDWINIDEDEINGAGWSGNNNQTPPAGAMTAADATTVDLEETSKQNDITRHHKSVVTTTGSLNLFRKLMREFEKTPDVLDNGSDYIKEKLSTKTFNPDKYSSEPPGRSRVRGLIKIFDKTPEKETLPLSLRKSHRSFQKIETEAKSSEEYKDDNFEDETNVLNVWTSQVIFDSEQSAHENETDGDIFNCHVEDVTAVNGTIEIHNNFSDDLKTPKTQQHQENPKDALKLKSETDKNIERLSSPKLEESEV
ncbi:hypothetical protein HELRODRAFT_169683 [Helobdella robusta]|uniref:Uncharacterized protein n=1 Tax=Helobdella robusta TaxID=6412 RepID=T1F281_HELRO|nr:hypothetical protein HELRODRAFT_169683 [Helobdella robusta]ESO07968.1 hypothetical protein HELRODRAFT_169683 [Helobdella robusta]